MELLWLGIGIGSTIAVMLPVMVVLLRRVVHRAREAEGEARHSQRLAELGSMTGGLAHEIKNPLTPIQLATERLKRRYRKQIEIDGELFDELID